MMTFNCKALWMRADVKLQSLIPIVQQLCLSELELPKDQQNSFFNQLFDTLIRGAELLKKCENISPFNPFLRYRYSSQILRLEEDIQGFLDLMPAHIVLDFRKLKQELQDYYDELHPADTNSMLKEFIYKQASLLTDNASRNAMLLQQMRIDDSCDNCEMDEGSNHSVHDIIPVRSQFYVGLEKSIGDLKKLLFHIEVSVVGVQCIGGGGKTTLALALCNDDDIKGYFQNVVFVTVSQSPNVKGLIETMWDKIVGVKRPQFQNVEDAHMQLQKQLQWQSKSTLVILDDVWSRSTVEKLIFQGARYKTLVTTRDSSAIPRNHSTQLYKLPLLGYEDAMSLFCFWAFGQTSIPANADAHLVNEVQAECKGLPLALKVIGSCLNGEPRVVWESAKNKLSKGEPISDYHRDGLLRCLETSISFLDNVARECFLDLAVFPEDKKICADALLHIWVYVRKLEWQDAFAILLELASRNLLNLTSNSRNAAEISASELYFSQHDVLRDLALYIGCQGSTSQRKRLIMHWKEDMLPGKWELLKDRPFDAQIHAIYTGLKQEYKRSFCEKYWVSGPSYFDRRRSYLAVKNEYLDMRRDYLERKDYSMRPSPCREREGDFVINKAEFLSIQQQFLAVKKDFMALKQDYQMRFEKDFDRMREFFLGSKRDELTPSLGPDFFSHDVFLSFRGKDVRGTLADHLFQSLSKAGLRVFLDSNSLKKGAKIWPSLKRAIEKSAICIPIYSEGYADSTWCLKESAAMLETPHLIIPLFYGVDPSDVRYPLNKRSPYKRSFKKHYGHPDRHPQGEIDGWKCALEDICSRSGWTMGLTQDCQVAVERIVKDVTDLLRSQKK